jgi:Ribosome-binding factor A
MKHRQLRVNELVKRELSGIIAREINFEGALVSINAVDVAPDLKSAHVFVSTLGVANGGSVIESWRRIARRCRRNCPGTSC